MMVEPNSKRFVDSFIQIEEYLQKELGNGDYKPFKSLVDHVAKSNTVIKLYQDELNSFGNLRNAIVHTRAENSEPIAEPHDSVVELIERIVREITTPEKVIPKFSRQVISFDHENS